MSSNFPKPILELPEVDIPVEGAKGYLSQGEDEQVIFMEFEKDVKIPEHSHDSQWEIVVAGKVDYYEGGVIHTYTKGDRFYIPRKQKHTIWILITKGIAPLITKAFCDITWCMWTF